MVAKTEPLGICDLCLQPFPPGVSLYVDKGKVRRYCSPQCVRTANSRNGNQTKSAKLKGRVIRAKITPALAEYIRKAAAAGESHLSIAHRLGVSTTAVKDHARKLVKIHRCKNCDKIIQRGKYCSAPDCRRAGNRTRDRKRNKDPQRQAKIQQWKDKHPPRKYPRKTWGIASGKRIELVCETCWRTFMRAIKDHEDRQRRGYKHIYCSIACYRNRSAAQKAVERKIKNITVLAGLIQKEEPEPRYNPAVEMSKPPESEEHMKPTEYRRKPAANSGWRSPRST